MIECCIINDRKRSLILYMFPICLGQEHLLCRGSNFSDKLMAQTQDWSHGETNKDMTCTSIFNQQSKQLLVKISSQSNACSHTHGIVQASLLLPASLLLRCQDVLHGLVKVFVTIMISSTSLLKLQSRVLILKKAKYCWGFLKSYTGTFGKKIYIWQSYTVSWQTVYGSESSFACGRQKHRGPWKILTLVLYWIFFLFSSSFKLPPLGQTKTAILDIFFQD